MRQIAVTGHRPTKLGGYDGAAKSRLQRFALSIVVREAVCGDLTMITGMALGWDQAIAHACMQARIPFVAFVPFAGQHLQWPQASQDEYIRLLEAAEQTVWCDHGSYAAWKMQKRNELMVDALKPDDFVIALFDGSAGGTKNCVDYATKRGARVQNAWQDWLQFQ